MENIPNELNELLWATAESKDAAMEAEFVERYPQLRAQLATRKAMLDVLKNARPGAVHARGFTPPQAASQRWWLVPAAAVLLVSLGFAAYKVTGTMYGAAPSVSTPSPAINPPRTDLGADGPRRPVATQANPESTAGLRDLGTAPRPVDPVRPALVRFRAGKVGLLSALRGVGTQGKVQLQVMPGVKDLALELKPNRPGGLLELSPLELLRLLETVAPIRIVDGGPEGYYVLPMEHVSNVESGDEGSRLAPLIPR